MQLLHAHPDWSQQPVIHVYYRERPPARHEDESQLVTPLVPGDDADRRESPSSASPVVHHHADVSQTSHVRVTDPFDDPTDHEDATITDFEETRQETPRNSQRNIEPPPQEVFQASLNSFVDQQEYHDSSYDNLASHGYNSTFHSTFRSLIGLPPHIEEPSPVLTEVAVQQPTILPVTDMAYPEYIHDTLAYVFDQPPARRNYYPLWSHVLEYWFPSTQGFEISQDWDPKNSNNMGGDSFSSRPKQSFAVFDITSPTEPFLFVNVHNALAVNDFTRRQARITMDETFETLRACSFGAGFETLCVISAVGAKWGMVMRETGWLDSDFNGDGDCVGDWEEDITTPESFNVMRYCFDGMKSSVQRRRQR